MIRILQSVPYSPFINRQESVLRLSDHQMRRLLTRIIVVSGIDAATALQIDEAGSENEESRQQHIVERKLVAEPKTVA